MKKTIIKICKFKKNDQIFLITDLPAACANTVRITIAMPADLTPFEIPSDAITAISLGNYLGTFAYKIVPYLIKISLVSLPIKYHSFTNLIVI